MRIFIQTCRGREAYVASLVERLPHAVVIKDIGHNPTRTWLRMLAESGDKGALFLEDDTILCRDFEQVVHGVVDRHRESVINIFAQKLDKADYYSGRHFCMNQGYWLPDGMAPEIISFSKTWPGHDEDHLLDWITRDYLQANKLQFWQEVPGLVDHRVGPSAIASRRPQDRRAKHFLGE